MASLNSTCFNAKILCKRFAFYAFFFQSGKPSQRAISRSQSVSFVFNKVVAKQLRIQIRQLLSMPFSLKDFTQTWPSNVPWNRVSDCIEILYFGGIVDSTPTLNWSNIQIFFPKQRTHQAHIYDSSLPKIIMQYMRELY